MSGIQLLVRENIKRMQPYSSARLENNASGVLLNANEYPDESTEGINRYPDPQPLDICSLLADIYGVQCSEILLTRGADEGIDLLVRTFCEPKVDKILICSPTYGMYSVSANIQDVECLDVPLLSEDFSLDKMSIIKAHDSKVKCLFLCSPNNPTGNLLDVSDIIELCERYRDQSIIVIDEAYIEFSSQESLSRMIKLYPNLVILRTLSKAYGLAGARVGALLASEEIIQILKKVIAPYPLSLPVIEIVRERFKNNKEGWSWIIDEKNRMSVALKTISIVETVYPSEANFLLIKVVDAEMILEYFREKNILIRDRRQHLCGEFLRISIGTPNQNQLILEGLRNVRT